MSNIYLDVGGLYEKAAEIAERALSVDPAAGYALTDIADHETLAAALESPLTGTLMVEGTLTGCLAALTRAPQAAHTITTVVVEPPPGSAVTTDDMDHAQAILATALADRLDDTQRSKFIREQLPTGYLGDGGRMSSIMLGLVVLTEEVLATTAESR